MGSMREIRRRIRSIRSTAQITNAMQMVAAAKMRKAQQSAIDVRPFIRLLYRIQRIATTRDTEFKHPFLEARPVQTRAVILVGSERGLCGALNSNVFRLAGPYDPQTTLFIAAGRTAAQFVTRTQRQLVAEFPYGDTPRFAESRAIAALARKLFVQQQVDEVRVIATRFVNTLVQEPLNVEFLPIGDIRSLQIPGAPPSAAADATQFVFEPDAGDIIQYLLGHYLNAFVHVVLLNAKASEHSARMVSMKGATENAAAMIKDLTLEYNKLRQGHITRSCSKSPAVRPSRAPLYGAPGK
jgi:F-type H+-transporting ATPase subunit gamma